MSVKKIKMNTLMMQALLAGRKTQTRRVGDCDYDVGDLLWVAEEWRPVHSNDKSQGIRYKADIKGCDQTVWREAGKMPMIASRATLLVTSVRRQMLQNISERDAIAEGLINRCDHTFPKWTAGDGFPEHFEFPIGAFKDLWQSIYPTGQFSWDKNPWVYVIVFKVIKQNIGEHIIEAANERI